MFPIICIIVGLAIIGAVYGNYGTKGCLVAVGCPVSFLVVIVGMGKMASLYDEYMVEKARQDEQNQSNQEEMVRIAEVRRVQDENKHRQEEKDEKIRSFALKESPKVWAVYQSLQSEIDVQSDKIEELRKVLVSFDKSPEQDVDFQRICALRDDMVCSWRALRIKLEDAYIASRKYEASPYRKDYQKIHKKALEEGILEAEAVETKFKEMRLNK